MQVRAEDASLNVGSFVQARWGKTWLSAKVLEMRGDSLGENAKYEVKVRFQGHDKDQDRWIPFPSPRIRPQVILKQFVSKGRRGAGCFTRPGDRVRIIQVDEASSSCFLARGVGMPGVVIRGRPDWDATYVRALTLLSKADVGAAGGGQGAECEAGPGPLPPSPTRLLEANAATSSSSRGEGDDGKGAKKAAAADTEPRAKVETMADFASILNEAAIGGAKENIIEQSFGGAWKERMEQAVEEEEEEEEEAEEEEEEEENTSIERPLRDGELVGVYWNAHIERVDESEFASMMKEVKALRKEIERVASFAAVIRKS